MEPSESTGLDLVSMILIFFGIIIVLAVLLASWVIMRVGRINLPDDADFVTAMRATPLSVVILLDVLDIGLDFLSAPAAWVLLSWLGLKPLRWLATIEGALPGTQLIPTMTLAWIVVRIKKSS